MTTAEESDEPSSSSHGLLADLNIPRHSNQLLQAQLPTWAFSVVSSSRNSPSPGVVETSTASTTTIPPRTTPSTASSLVSQPDPPTPVPPVQQPSLFNTPNRSIFSSGPPTSSLSASTAQASMSTPPPINSTSPFSTLAVPSSASSRRPAHYQSERTASLRRDRILNAEKDVDDLSVTANRTRSAERRSTSTPTALTRLFTAPEASTPTVSRHASYIRTPSGTSYTRGMSRTILIQRSRRS